MEIVDSGDTGATTRPKKGAESGVECVEPQQAILCFGVKTVDAKPTCGGFFNAEVVGADFEAEVVVLKVESSAWYGAGRLGTEVVGLAQRWSA
ncbi:hypothetical protein NDU88_002384 [Pleurodeles waltl]|uniref:Uncharacterized protein n=1 Tax=Pleurodeles waltl TaxID=8319 RepID=A0AAV7WQ21_PLEWA|nr:hypothetical protein NDU88_002384 [Pleurodeles waltl]